MNRLRLVKSFRRSFSINLRRHEAEKTRQLPETIEAVGMTSTSSFVDRADEYYTKLRSKKDAPFPGANHSVFTEKLDFNTSYPVIPTYRVLDTDGVALDPSQDPNLPAETLRNMYVNMITLNIMDTILYDAQRQGRISFYMTNYGEEGTHMGSSAALKPQDMIFGQYREAGVLMYRGFTLDEFMSQCFSNELDSTKGRQMPVHYGSKRLNFQTISSPLATQIPQAAGAAYALKRKYPGDAVVCVYFGEGAASEGDFHSGMNIASVTDSPCIFFCRNNGFAISTPSKDQYRGDGIASRAHGYGMAAIRVDGNDTLAVYNATKAAREYALKHNKPILIEAMTYRVGHHSTSDDSSAYRSKQEVEAWKRYDSPTVRFRQYLEKKGLWSEVEEQETRTKQRTAVLKAFNDAEKRQKPPVDYMFTDVFDEMTPQLKEQWEEVQGLIKRYPDIYNTTKFADKAEAEKRRREAGLS